MTWTEAQAAAAADEGWSLVDVIDNGSKRPHLRVWPTDRALYVYARAKQFSALHIAALQAVVNSCAPKKAKR